MKKLAELAAVHRAELKEQNKGRLDVSLFKTEPHKSRNQRICGSLHDQSLDCPSSYMDSLHDQSLDCPSSSMLCYSPKNSVVLFDWDDTLFPTWFIMNVVRPCMPPASFLHESLPSDSPFIEVLEAHAEVLRNTLQAARRVARVAIVTLARKPWVLSSANMFLPSLNLDTLLKELQIPIYYARESVNAALNSQLRHVDEGVDPYKVAKRCAMKKCLNKFYKGSTLKWNVVSIGDSTIERDAIKDLLWSSEELKECPHCKTLKFVEDPTLEQLGNELQVAGRALNQVLYHPEDLDFSFDSPESISDKKFSLECGHHS
jgi:hypothetical protein